MHQRLETIGCVAPQFAAPPIQHRAEFILLPPAVKRSAIDTYITRRGRVGPSDEQKLDGRALSVVETIFAADATWCALGRAHLLDQNLAGHFRLLSSLCGTGIRVGVSIARRRSTRSRICAASAGSTLGCTRSTIDRGGICASMIGARRASAMQ